MSDKKTQESGYTGVTMPTTTKSGETKEIEYGVPNEKVEQALQDNPGARVTSKPY